MSATASFFVKAFLGVPLATASPATRVATSAPTPPRLGGCGVSATIAHTTASRKYQFVQKTCSRKPLIFPSHFFAHFQQICRHAAESPLCIVFIRMRNVDAVGFARRNQWNEEHGDKAFVNRNFGIYLMAVSHYRAGFLARNFACVACYEEKHFGGWFLVVVVGS